MWKPTTYECGKQLATMFRNMKRNMIAISEEFLNTLLYVDEKTHNAFKKLKVNCTCTVTLGCPRTTF